ncbi:class I SAM-dependent methyltransferase [Nostoc sp.]|uniref:class I SAM-dependent methyltransferase n=1 Tax=Nostoc sp. TaxID=1180 RepID=UPI002FFBF12F
MRSANVVFITEDITKQWTCRNQSADLVTCNLVLEHIEDLSLIFSEASRVLVKGGYFFICELHPFKQYQGTKANFQRQQEFIKFRHLCIIYQTFLTQRKFMTSYLKISKSGGTNKIKINHQDLCRSCLESEKFFG